MQTQYVYLLHFSKPVSDRHTCQHYLGSADDVLSRMYDHTHGRGARLCQVAKERGITFTLVRLWPGNRTVERTFKNLKNAPKLCPLCNPKLRQLALFDSMELQIKCEVINSGLLHAHEFNVEDVNI